MITIFPLPAGAAFERAAQSLGGSPQVILEAKDGDELLGLIGFTIHEDTLHICALRAYASLITDGLIKSAMSYAAQRELPWCTAEDGPDAQPFLSIGFTQKDGLLRLRLDASPGICSF